ncbi:hypothetical protein D5085_17325 [Ectothiorhodospiraceae bacterium BW-2]|nr:hypothetical protein D5085_17325 [Ectothiorhodospiraceae bacterium BW-2]
MASAEPDSLIMVSSATAAEHLVNQIGEKMIEDRRLLVTSFVNIHNLNDSAPFGRVAAQIYSTQFTNYGFSVLETRMRSNLAIREQQGEFILSRELDQISQEHRVQGVLVGTYAIAGEQVFITARVIDSADNVAIASFDYRLPLNDETRPLFKPAPEHSDADRSLYGGVINNR